MSDNWFFERTEVVAAKPQQGRLRLSDESMAKLTPGSVKSMNREAEHPDMQPTGSKTPDVYILKGFPSAKEDEVGKPFCDVGSRLLKGILSVEHQTRYGHVVRTRPPQGRQPTELELAAFRTVVEKDIAEHKPKVVIGLGLVVLRWMLGKVTQNTTLRVAAGRFFPVNVRGHVCWFMPAENPDDFLAMMGDAQFEWNNLQRLRVKDQMVKSDAPIWRKRITSAYKLAKRNSHIPYIAEADALQGIAVMHATGQAKDFRLLKDRIERTLAKPSFTFDIETSALRPYSDDAEFVCMSVCDGADSTYCFMIDHPQESWGKFKGPVLELVKKLFRAKATKVAHNAMFEAEWASKKFGWKSVMRGRWECTQAQAYVLDERAGGMSLQFLSTLNFGLKIKDVTGVDRSKPREADPQQLLLYCGLDSKITWLLHQFQAAKIKKEKLENVYEDQLKRIPSFVLCQLQGLPVDQAENKKLAVEFDSEIAALGKKIEKSKLVKKYRKRFGDFNVDSPQQVLKLYKEVADRDGNGSNSANEEALKAFGGPLAEAIVKRRKYNKLKQTYVEPLELGSERCVVFPDNHIHCSYNATLTSTGRPSAQDPNTLNYPKRSEIGKRCRQPFVAPPGHVYLSLDLGQAEYRVIGMASKDKVIIDSCYTDYDVHMEWAKRIAKEYPRILDKPQYLGINDEAKRWKALRTDIKNQWVFPAFYGAILPSREGYLEVPRGSMERVDKAFWKTFHGVLDFQIGVKEFYAKHGYVECLNGRRRHGPISPNKLINSPIQGSAFEIAMDAHYRLCLKAYETNKLYLAPRLNIYDDLTCIVPKKDADWCKQEMVAAMLGCKYKWINVPLLAELSEGPNWKDLHEIGKFTSKHKRTD